MQAGIQLRPRLYPRKQFDDPDRIRGSGEGWDTPQELRVHFDGKRRIGFQQGNMPFRDENRTVQLVLDQGGIRLLRQKKPYEEKNPHERIWGMRSRQALTNVAVAPSILPSAFQASSKTSPDAVWMMKSHVQ